MFLKVKSCKLFFFAEVPHFCLIDVNISNCSSIKLIISTIPCDFRVTNDSPYITFLSYISIAPDPEKNSTFSVEKEEVLNELFSLKHKCHFSFLRLSTNQLSPQQHRAWLRHTYTPLGKVYTLFYLLPSSPRQSVIRCEIESSFSLRSNFPTFQIESNPPPHLSRNLFSLSLSLSL